MRIRLTAKSWRSSGCRPRYSSSTRTHSQGSTGGVLFPAVALGWNNQNPQLQRFLAQTGRQPLLRAMCADPSILVVAEKDRLEVVTQYLREHFRIEVAWAEAYAGSFHVWRCSVSGNV
jgi:hypothetical protein